MATGYSNCCSEKPTIAVAQPSRPGQHASHVSVRCSQTGTSCPAARPVRCAEDGFLCLWALSRCLEPGARVLWAPAPTSLQPTLNQALPQVSA